MALSLNVVNSRVGRALRAIHASEAAADSVGVDSSRYKLQVLVLSAVFASMAGSLYVHYMRFVSPQPFDFAPRCDLVVMAAVGGLASVWGAPFGAAAVMLLTVLLRESLPLIIPNASGEHTIIVYGIILVADHDLYARGADQWAAQNSDDGHPSDRKTDQKLWRRRRPERRELRGGRAPHHAP